jgi:hypothetical protein
LINRQNPSAFLSDLQINPPPFVLDGLRQKYLLMFFPQLTFFALDPSAAEIAHGFVPLALLH